MTKLDVEKLEYVAKWLEAGAPHTPEGQGFNMDEWMRHSEEDFYAVDYQGHACGTAMCIGGALEQFFGLGADKEVGLEVSDGEWTLADQLFYPWDHFSRAIDYNDPLLAAKVIRHLIATGEVNWEIKVDE